MIAQDVQLDLWPAWFCEHCTTQEPNPFLWFLNHGICRMKAGAC